MVRHIVLFEFKTEVDRRDREKLFSKMRKLSEIKSVRSLTIGTLLQPSNPDYLSHMSQEFGHSLLIDFDNEEQLYGYQADPYHVEVGRSLRELVSEIKIVDFTI